MKKLIGLVLLTACGHRTVEQRIISGTPGPQGIPGHSAVVEQVPASIAQCSNGGVVIVSSVDIDDSGTVSASDFNIQSAVVCAGTNGTNGTNGQNAAQSSFTPVKAIAPCGIHSANYKEVLLLLADGSLLSSFSDNVSGYNTRLAFLPDGSYMDTDGSNCQFSVSTNGPTRSITWSGGGESWLLQ